MVSQSQITILESLRLGIVLRVDEGGSARGTKGKKVPSRTLSAMLKRGLVEISNGRVCLTRRGNNVLDDLDLKRREHEKAERAYSQRRRVQEYLFSELGRIALTRGTDTSRWRLGISRGMRFPEVAFAFITGVPDVVEAMGGKEIAVFVQVDVFGRKGTTTRELTDIFDSVHAALDNYEGPLLGRNYGRIVCNEVGRMFGPRHMSEWTIWASNEPLPTARYGSMFEQGNRRFAEVATEMKRRALLAWIINEYDADQWAEVIRDLATDAKAPIDLRNVATEGIELRADLDIRVDDIEWLIRQLNMDSA